MIDPSKAESLKENIKRMREVRNGNESVEDREARLVKTTKAINYLFILALRITVFHFTQSIILRHFSISTFYWWESLTIFFGLMAISSIFKKAE
jgi:uncharacterized membrane protein